MAFLLPCRNTTIYKRLQRLLYRPCKSYTTYATKRRTGLYRRFSCGLSHFTAADARPAQTDIIPPAPRWSVSQRRSASSTYPRYQTQRRTLYSSAQPPYYNKVYKGAGVRPYYGSMPDSAAYRRPCQPGGAVQRQGRGTIGGLCRISFRAFAR